MKICPKNLGLWAAYISTFASSWLPILVREMKFGSVALTFWQLLGVGSYCVITLYAKGGRLSWRVLRYSLIAGILYVVNIVTFFEAVRNTSMINAMVISATAPIFLIWIASRFFTEKVNSQIILATVLAIVGAILVVLSDDSGNASRLGDLIAIISLISFLFRLTVSRRVIHHRLTVLEFMAGHSVIAAVFTLPIALISPDPLIVNDVQTWGWILLSIVIVGIGQSLANYSHNYISLKLYSLLGPVQSVVTVIWAWLIFNEQLDSWQWFGTPLVVTSIIIALLNEKSEDANLPKKQVSN